MKNMILQLTLAFALLGGFCASASAQSKVFDWVPANDESVRLDPGYYHTGRTYRPNPGDASIHVAIRAQKPITIFLTPEEDWKLVLQDPRALSGLRRECLREHVTDSMYECTFPGRPMTLVIFDERNSPDAAVFAGLSAVLDDRKPSDRAIGTVVATVLTGSGSGTKQFKSPNDLHIQYHRWLCVQNCVQPEYLWSSQFKEKYEITPQPKIYGGYAPKWDEEEVIVKINSPVPMTVALLPAQIAGQLYAKPELLETALAETSCQQRGVQKLRFVCKFNLADGPQSLVVLPEARGSVPRKKKAEIEMRTVNCVANCELIEKPS